MFKQRFARLLYQLSNWKSHYRAVVYGTALTVSGVVMRGARLLGVSGARTTFRGQISAKVIRSEANRPKGWRGLFWTPELDLGVISRRVVTTVGVRFLCDDFNAGASSADVSAMKYHDSGTGSVAEAAADTALGTVVTDNLRTVGSQASATSGANATYTTVGTIAYTGAHAITEHGLFSDTRANTGTLWDRSVFSAINVANGDSIQFTYVLTANSGG